MLSKKAMRFRYDKKCVSTFALIPNKYRRTGVRTESSWLLMEEPTYQSPTCPPHTHARARLHLRLHPDLLSLHTFRDYSVATNPRSLVFTCIHLCALVIICNPCIRLHSPVFICFHLCSLSLTCILTSGDDPYALAPSATAPCPHNGADGGTNNGIEHITCNA